MDFWISEWISGFHGGFLDFVVDFWISQWISLADNAVIKPRTCYKV